MPKRKDVFGGCKFEKVYLPSTKASSKNKVINVIISFEEALKLNLAIDECLRQLNSYNRANKAGKKAALKLAVKIDLKRVEVFKGSL